MVERARAWHVPRHHHDRFAALDKALNGQSEAKQLEIMRLQIDMRVIGLGWDKFRTKWSAKSDPTIGTVAHLKSLLLEINRSSPTRWPSAA